MESDAAAVVLTNVGCSSYDFPMIVANSR